MKIEILMSHVSQRLPITIAQLPKAKARKVVEEAEENENEEPPCDDEVSEGNFCGPCP